MRTAQTADLIGKEFCAENAEHAQQTAERLEAQLRQEYGLPFTAVFCVWDKRRFAIVLPPHLSPKEWQVLRRWRVWDTQHQEYFRCAILRRGDILLTVEQRYVAVGDTYVFCSVITQSHAAHT